MGKYAVLGLLLVFLMVLSGAVSAYGFRFSAYPRFTGHGGVAAYGSYRNTHYSDMLDYRSGTRQFQRRSIYAEPTGFNARHAGTRYSYPYLLGRYNRDATGIGFIRSDRTSRFLMSRNSHGSWIR